MDRQALDARNTDAGASSDTVPSMTSYYSSRKKQKTEASDLIQKGISTNVKAVGTALSRMNQQSAMSDINNLINTKRELKNEWRKERKQTNYDSDVDGEYYANALQELESLIVAQQQFLEDLKNDNSD